MLAGRFGLLGDRGFRLLFLGQVVSLLGSAIAPIALSFAVLDLTGRTADLAVVLAARTAPQLLFLLVGGVLADRLRRLRVMVAANLASAVSQGALALLLLTDTGKLWELAALAAVNGTAVAFFFPASTGIVPQLIDRSRLQTANALLRLARNGTQVIGAAAAGVLIAATSPGWGITADAVSYLCSALILLAIRVPSNAKPPQSRFRTELRAGWSEFISRTWLWVIVAQFAVVNAANSAGFLLLGPVVADRRLGGAAAWGYVIAAQAAGFVLGGVVALRWRPRRPLYVATLAVFPLAIPMLALAASLPTAVVAATAGLAGLCLEQFGVQWSTALQQHVPLALVSRVSSYDALGSVVFIPIGYLVGGVAASLVGTDATLWGSAALVIAATSLALLSSDLRRLSRSDPE